MEFSVVIPTYNRAPLLAKTLEALKGQSILESQIDCSPDPKSSAPQGWNQRQRPECQTLDQDPKWPASRSGEWGAKDDSYEVVVVNDGSSDETAEVIEEMRADYPVRLRNLYQPNQKQGAARNLGSRNANGTYLVFLGDDTVPAADLLAQHRVGRTTSDPRQVVIGYTTWAPNYERTRFMEYIGEQGWQFGFSLIKDPEDVPFNFFYTSNLSICRRFFWEVGGFDETFTEYGWENIELSLRLKKTRHAPHLQPESHCPSLSPHFLVLLCPTAVEGRLFGLEILSETP